MMIGSIFHSKQQSTDFNMNFRKQTHLIKSIRLMLESQLNKTPEAETWIKELKTMEDGYGQDKLWCVDSCKEWGSEVTGIGDKKTAPDDINVINPAFDITPPELISGIITEKGVAKPPYEESIKKLFEAN